MKSAIASLPAWKVTFTAGWVVANLIGMFVFLEWSAACCWIEPELKDMPGASGGAAFVWGFGPFLIFAAFMLANLGWAAMPDIIKWRERRWRSYIAPLLMLSLWGAAFVFDGLHHGS
jgi:hypothetical protein